MSYIPNSGSVVAFQGTVPFSVLGATTGSIISVQQGSVATVIIGGSIAASFTPPANQSVSGTVHVDNFSSVIALQAAGSVLAVSGSFTPAANQSVSGTVQVDVRGSVATVIIGGSVAVATGNSSVQVLNFPANQSVSGNVGISGNVTVVSSLAGGIFPVSGSVSAVVTNFPTTQNVSGSVVATQGTTPWQVVSSLAGGIFPISGSVAAVITGTPNVNTAGSVVAFQGGAPWTQTFSNSSIYSFQLAGSVLATSATVNPAANQSVSGRVETTPVGTIVTSLVSTVPSSVLVGTSIFGQLPAGTAMLGSVAALQAGTVPWLQTFSNSSIYSFQLAGSVLATSATVTPAANQSVSGTVQVDVRSSVAVVIIGGSVATATTNSSVMLLNSAAVIGSVIAYQGTPSWNVSGSVAAFQAGTQITSVSGTVTVSEGADTPSATASILVGVTANTNGSVLTVTGYQMAAMQITSGPGASITGAINFEGTLDGTQFVPINGYNPTTNAISSMATIESNWMFNVAGLQGIRARVSNWSVGSITARAVASPEDARPFAVAAHSVSGTVNLGIGATMIGSVVAYQGATPWVTVGSVYQGTGWSGSVAAIQTGQSGTVVTSIVAASPLQVVSSLAGGIFPVSGSVSATLITGAAVIGSVATLQGTNPWVVVGSVYGNISGSVAAFQLGTWKTSIASNYTSNTASIVSAIGDLVLGIRNDTMTSVMATGDGFYSPILIGPVGEQVVANAPIHKWVQGTQSFLGGTPLNGGSVAVIAAQGASIFTYITSGQIMNPSANNVYVRIFGATDSIIGFTVAPTNGGSNLVIPNAWKSNANGAISASVSGSASVYIALQGFISKT